MAAVFAQHGPRIAAVITEPVQGAGGVLMPPDGYLEDTRRLCDSHGALLIFDEVITGFGRTGSWFGSQTLDVTPDLITFAKGASSGYLPLSGVVVNRRVCAVLEGMDGLLRTGYTYSGHPACAAAGIKNIEIISDENLVDRANQIGVLLDAGLAAMQKDGLIESYRGVGALWGAELGRDVARARTELLDRGVIVRPIGTVLALCPPLVITKDEVATVLDQMSDVLSTH
jgi:putrescine aminotransferase